MPIYRVETSDLESLAAISDAAIEHGVSAPPEVLADFKQLCRKYIALDSANPECAFLKFVEVDVILGYILVKDYWNLSNLFVLPAHQKRGVGKALLEEALSICRANSSRGYVRLNSSLNAVQFYQRLGFVEANERVVRRPYSVPMEYFL